MHIFFQSLKIMFEICIVPDNKAISTVKQVRMRASDFETKAVIGRGHFGEVRVVKEKSTEEVYAMKVLRKSDILSQLNVCDIPVG